VSRAGLVRAGACGTALGGLVLALTATMYLVAASAAVYDWPPWSGQSGGYFLLYSGLSFAFWVAPAAILLGILGLYTLFGRGTRAGLWGFILCAVATLVSPVGSALPYFFFPIEVSASYTADNASMFLFLQSISYVLQTVLLACGLALLYLAARRHGALGRWLPILPVLACAAVLSAALPFAATETGLQIGTALSQALATIYGLLWMTLGVAALWRHAPGARPPQTPTVPANL
jgi:hypothetical protein